jgi:hypothetical protein
VDQSSHSDRLGGSGLDLISAVYRGRKMHSYGIIAEDKGCLKAP